MLCRRSALPITETELKLVATSLMLRPDVAHSKAGTPHAAPMTI